MSAYPPPPDVISGRVAWVFGDDFDIDLVVGVANIKSYDPEHLRSVCMTAYDPGFVDRVRPGDIIVGGRNFGYGHPHYPPMVALRNAGIQAIVAESFSPGFWRGETFNGVPLITIPDVSGAVVTGDAVELDWRRAALTTADGRSLVGSAPSPRTVAVIEAGGSYELLLAEHRSKQPLTGQGSAR
ncbi:3-isopropylmalate dehydratase [Rhodococcoides fascians]|uniref:3-isopropylmalate dehydratase n=1 Tax=Rhodococcoides fascians TaxID=1828 RepID=UPI00050C87B3|nr:3-isopropylmalate dehydratase [Rhodococcus fascians]AMY52967.1 2,3-dimethylmalate dehydratase small subunit [Rhodococcus fascians D188]